MWVFLNDAFLSIVADRSDPSLLLVRARRRNDILVVFAEAVVIRTPTRDYAWRSVLPRKMVEDAMAAEVKRINYFNFKDTVPKSDHARHSAYLRVWATMEQFQKPKRRKGDRQYDLLDASWGGR